MIRRLAPALAALAAGAGVFTLMRWLRRKREASEEPEPEEVLPLVEEAGLESFPASDAPSWTLGEEPSIAETRL